MPPKMTRSRKIAESLAATMYEIRSAHAIAMDDLVVNAIFAKVRTDEHIPQTLGTEFEAPGRALIAFHGAFQLKKNQLFSDDGGTVIRAATDITTILRRDRDQNYFRRLNPEEIKVLQWCISIYALLLGPESPVRLRASRIGRDRVYGFGIYAKQDIPGGTEIWDVIGIMPTDHSTPQTDLSTITVAAGQNQRPGATRVMFGPMRMLNHRCKSFNCEYLFKESTSLFVLQINIDVMSGEELTVNYGSNWFAGDCPCSDCDDELVNGPTTSSSSTPPEPSPSLRALQERQAILASTKEQKAEEFRENRKRQAEATKADKAERKRVKQAEKRRAKGPGRASGK